MFRTRGFIFRKTIVYKVWCSVFYVHQYKQSCTDACKTLYLTFIHNRLPENEPSGSKNAEDIKN